MENQLRIDRNIVVRKIADNNLLSLNDNRNICDRRLAAARFERI
jgi:hypothetical protein